MWHCVCLLTAVSVASFLPKQCIQKRWIFKNTSETFSTSFCSLGQMKANSAAYEGALDLLSEHFVPWEGRCVTWPCDSHPSHDCSAAWRDL